MNPSHRPRVLVIDDQPDMLRLLTKILDEEAEVAMVSGAASALELLGRERVAVIFGERRIDGLDLLSACKRMQPTAVFVLLTRQHDEAIEGMRAGAYDYLPYPFTPEDLRTIVLRALGRASGAGDDPSTLEAGELLPGVITRSAIMHELAELVRRLARSDVNVLVLGERGTGKRQIARALHALGLRAERPFLTLDCAALSGEQLELELCGQGARAGLLEQAEGGMVSLSAIDELRASLQAKLARALAQRSIRRLGDDQDRPIDVRVIAASHMDLEAMVREGTFRAELFELLGPALLRVPPLRERSEDIPLLVRRFLTARAEKRRQLGRPEALEPSTAALALLRSAGWPGNVAQLRAVIERAGALAQGSVIELDDLPDELVAGELARQRSDAEQGVELASMTWQSAIDRARDRMAPRYLRTLLAVEQGNVVAAAARAGIERESFYRLLRKYGVRADEFRGRGS